MRLTYNMYAIKDQIDVLYDGDLVAATGDYASGTGTIWFWYDGPQSGPDVCEVQVDGPSASTGWTARCTVRTRLDAAELGATARRM